MRRFLKAVEFLTVFPVSPSVGTGTSLGSSAGFFPVVGLLIGAASYAAFFVADRFLPMQIGAVVLVAVPVILTGGLHIDGLGDFCDGFFSGRRDREEILRIMKDSRIGVMAALGIFFVLLVKYAAFLNLRNPLPVILTVSAAARTAQILLGYFVPYVGSGTGKGFAGEISRRDLWFASSLTVGVSLFCGIEGAVILAAAFTVTVCLTGLTAQRRIGGVTGDVLGAVSEFTEASLLVSACALHL